MAKSKTVTVHPATWKRFQVAAARWMKLRDEQRRVSDRLWLGTMVSQFTADELRMLADKGYLSERDFAWIKSVPQRIA